MCTSVSRGPVQDNSLPALPTLDDAPDKNWIWDLSTAPLHDLRGLKVCRRLSVSPCRSSTGVLLLYRDGSQCGLGDVYRDWPLDSEEEVPREHFRYRNLKDGLVHYIVWKVVHSGLDNATDMADNEGWISIPQSGTIRWWFGQMGNWMVIDPNDPMWA